MLQSQILSVLPRRMLASLWASAETRLTVNVVDNGDDDDDDVVAQRIVPC